ncbi:MAG: tetratricopeptide repeat protein [Pseudomonadota bacterium]
MSAAALSLLILPLAQSALIENARDEQVRLETCIENAETDALVAYEDSLAWLSNGNRPKARYCNAVALIALEEYEEGAARLEALATAPDAVNLEDRALYMAQAGNAWLTANYPDAAIRALDDAIKMRSSDPELYKDRGSAHIALEQWLQAIDDLNAALDLVPGDAETLAMRARANLGFEQLRDAQSDIEAAIVIDPSNIDFLVLRGDIREAIRLAE